MADWKESISAIAKKLGTDEAQLMASVKDFYLNIAEMDRDGFVEDHLDLMAKYEPKLFENEVFAVFHGLNE